MVSAPGHYLGHPQTLALMKSEYVYPGLSHRGTTDEWNQEGRADIHHRARHKVREVLAGHFPDHIACDSASRSEIVLPLVAGERLIGVFDLDSPDRGRFTSHDREGLEQLAAIFIETTFPAN